MDAEKKDQAADVVVTTIAGVDATTIVIAIMDMATVSLALETIPATVFSGSFSSPACAEMADATMDMEITEDTTADATMDVIPAGFLLFSCFYAETTVAAN